MIRRGGINYELIFTVPAGASIRLCRLNHHLHGLWHTDHSQPLLVFLPELSYTDERKYQQVTNNLLVIAISMFCGTQTVL